MEPTPQAETLAQLLALGRDALRHGAKLYTSGTTGAPRQVALSASALRASALATAEWFSSGGGRGDAGRSGRGGDGSSGGLGLDVAGDRSGRGNDAEGGGDVPGSGNGHGRWVLALPTDHVAGLQVCLRAVLAEEAGVPDPLVIASTGGGPTARALADALHRALADEAPVFISLVPTQLARLLAAKARAGGGAASKAAEAVRLLGRVRAILLGGAAASGVLLAQAAAEGLPVVRTYGATETAGGCVYSPLAANGGLPLPGVRVRIVGGRIEIAGPILAGGYIDDPQATAEAFSVEADGTRWFRTSDLGRLGPNGRLHVIGRADNAIVSGGIIVHPGQVEALLGEALSERLHSKAVAEHGESTAERHVGTAFGVSPAHASEASPSLNPPPSPDQASALGRVCVCVVGLPDLEWGQRVVAVYETSAAESPAEADEAARLERAPEPLGGAIRGEVAFRLGAAAAPKDVYFTPRLPRTALGKVDRPALIVAITAFETFEGIEG